MFCGNCGKFVEEGSKFCTNCGQRVTAIDSNLINEEPNVSNNTNPINMGNTNNNHNKISYEDEVVCKTQDKVNVWLLILGFLFPLIGLILFIALRKETPKKANAIGIAALIGFVLGFIISIIVVIGLTNSTFKKFYEDYNYYDDSYYYYDDYEEFDELEYEFEKFYEENKI